MRPVELRLQAFGSFAGSETVDFTAPAHQGLFVVAGPTGGGKSTIFDAMTFALYGKLPGDRPADVRSHHASAEVVTEVELVFEVDGRRYRVLRRPAQDRPKRRGYGSTTTPAEAVLSEWTGAGWQGCLTGATQVAAHLGELIGLDVEQFQRVVLLPQGKFAEFLLADTGKRQTLLRQLFGTGLYDRATLWLRDEVARLSERAHESDIEIDHERRVAVAAVRVIGQYLGPDVIDRPIADDSSLDELDRSLTIAARHIGRRRDEHDDGERLRAALASEAAIAADLARRFDRAQQLDETRRSLLSDADQMRSMEERVAQARRVEPVVAALRAVELITEQVELTNARVSTVRREIESTVDGIGETFVDDPMTMLGVLNARHARSVAAAERLLLLDRRRVEHHQAAEAADAARRGALTARADLDAIHDQIVAIGQRRVLVDKRAGKRVVLAEEVAGLATVVEQRHRLDRLAGELQIALDQQAEAQQHEHDLIARFAAGVAPRLAAELRPGEPCSVCGGIEHPAPARATDGLTVIDPRQVEEARNTVDRLREARTRLVAEVVQISTSLGNHADRFLELVEIELAEVTDRLADAEQAVRELKRVDRELSVLTQRHDAADELVRSTSLGLAAAETMHTIAVGAVDEAEAAAAGIDGAAITSDLEVLVGLLDRVPLWQDELDAHTRVVAELSVRSDALAAALLAAGLTATDEVLDLAIDPDEIHRLERSVAEWHAAVTRTADALEEVNTLGVPELRPDAEGLQVEADRLGRSAASGLEALANLETALRDGRRATDAARLAVRDSEPMRAQLDVTRRVMATCTGTIGPGGQRITLETWVLAAELDRVAIAATEHLRRLSHGRYELRRGAPVAAGNRRTGLDILLFDAHTGRERGPRTLSGGEQFQASLALALGLADVVSRGGSASGRLFEALFVDEGFGSLDPAALDDAIDALQHLQATGRMVGVITHVEAMKHQLPIGIEVRHRPDGRGSQIVQEALAR